MPKPMVNQENVSEPTGSVPDAGDGVIVSPPEQPWYRRILRRFIPQKNILTFVGLGVFLLVGIVIAQSMERGSKQVQIKATSHQVSVNIYPKNQSLTPNGDVQLWIHADSSVAFAHVEITFDPSKVKIYKEITLTSSLATVVEKSTMSEANNTGRIVIAVALPPASRNSPPTKAIKLSDMTFAAQTNAANVSTTLTIPPDAVTIVSADASLYTVTTNTETLILNPVSTPTPTATPISTSTPSSTATPTPSSTPKVTSTAAPQGNLIQNPSFENTGSNWYSPWWFEADDGAAADISQDKTTAGDGAASAKIHVTKSSTTNWNVQFMNGLGITSGRTYTVSFWAKADANRSIGLEINHKTSPYTNYFKANAALTTSWQKFTYSFTPTVTDDNTLILFYFANNTGNVWLDGVSVN